MRHGAARSLAGAHCARDVDSREDASHRRADSQFSLQQEEISGDHSGGETPVPIPNTAVKPTSADGTALATGWESRSLPGISFCLFFRRLRISAAMTLLGQRVDVVWLRAGVDTLVARVDGRYPD